MDAISSSVLYPVGSDIMNRDGGKGGLLLKFDPARIQATWECARTISRSGLQPNPTVMRRNSLEEEGKKQIDF